MLGAGGLKNFGVALKKQQMIHKMNNPSFWFQLKIALPEEAQEVASALLFAEGAVGMENRPDTLVAYFPPETDGNRLLQKTEKFLASQGQRAPISLQKIPAENWQENWKENFKPLPVGRRFLVTPPWENPENPENRLVLKIDPGMAFGTGTHETTQLVLYLMEEVVRPGKRVWDVGAGSGILAIGAAKMGVRGIVANDVDPDAVRAAVENARLNRVPDAISFFVGGPEALADGLFDLILVNILSSIILEILPSVLSHLAPNGRVIFSGVLGEEKTAFLDRLEQFHLKIEKTKEQGEWLGIVAARKEPT